MTAALIMWGGLFLLSHSGESSGLRVLLEQSSLPIHSRTVGVPGDAEPLVEDVSDEVRKAFETKYQIRQKCAVRLVDLVTDDGEDADYAGIMIVRDRCTSLAGRVQALASHEHPRVRRRVAEILAGIGTADSVRVLLQLLNDRDDEVRATSIRACCTVDPGECRNKLRELALADTSWRVRRSAILASRAAQYELSVEDVNRLLDDPVGDVRDAVFAVASCRAIQEDGVRRRLLVVVQGKEVAGRSLKYSAIRALDRCGGKGVADGLMAAFDSEVRDGQVDERTPILIDALTSNAGVRAKALVEAFAAHHPSSSDMAQVTASNERTPQEAAFDALGKIGDRRSTVAISKGIGDPYYRVRVAALRAMEALGLAKAFEKELRQLVESDSSELVREQAHSVLEHIEH